MIDIGNNNNSSSILYSALFLRTLQNMSLLAASFICLGNSFHSLGADGGKDLFPYIALWLLGTLKSEQDSDRSILTGTDFSIRSLRYTGAVPFSTLNVRNRILYNDLKRTGSQCS